MPRIYPDANGHTQPQRGDYWQDADGLWWIETPTGFIGVIAAHTIEEHDDGTISVTPSILVPTTCGPQWQWHGYLTRGEWREC